MDAKLLIETLKTRGVELRVNGDGIQAEAPQEPDPDTKALLDEVRQHREEVKALLTDSLLPDDTPGVTVADVLRVFGGGLVIEEDKPLSCWHCNEKKGVPHWRKGGKIIRRIRADGDHVWACHFCGREARGKTVCQMNRGPEMGGNGLRNIPFLLRRPVRERVLAT